MSTRVTMRGNRYLRTLPPGELRSELAFEIDSSKPAKAAGRGPRIRRRRQLPRKLSVLVAIGALLVGVSGALATFNDTGTVNVQVADKKHSVVDATTDGHAFVSYFGDSDTTFGSSGTGTFTPFVRLQASPTEQGFNTDAAVTFDAKSGTWTHSIKVSQIPQRPCPQLAPTLTCFELFVDINESNTAKNIALNKLEVYFTNNASLTGYPFTLTATTTKEYAFNGSIEINDVNQGSGRGDLRYDIPINGADPIAIPPNCSYGNAACSTYFVLYSQWGTAPSATYNSEGGFEEWKVKVYPIPATTLTTVSQTPSTAIHSGTPVTIVVRETNTGNDPLTNVNVVGTGCTPFTPASVASLAPGTFADFTCTFSPTTDTAWTATAHATDSSGAPAPSAGEVTSGNVDVIHPRTALTTVSQLPANPVLSGTSVTITVNEANTGDDVLSNVSVTGTGCTSYTPASVATLAVGANVDFTCTFSPTVDTPWTATGHGTDSLGTAVPGTGESTSGNVSVKFQPAQTTAQTWSVFDSMTITVGGGGNLAGTAHFALHRTSDCSDLPFYTQNVGVSGASGTSVSTTVVALTTFTADEPILYWNVSYTSTNAAQADIPATCTENTNLDINN